MSEEIWSDEDHGGRTSRRTLLKGATLGVGALWVAPAISTLTATPAAASTGCNALRPEHDGGTEPQPRWLSGLRRRDEWVAHRLGRPRCCSRTGLAPGGVRFQATSSVDDGTAIFVRDFTEDCQLRFDAAPSDGMTLSVDTSYAGAGGGVTAATLILWDGPAGDYSTARAG